jgi:hypothetical protein
MDIAKLVSIINMADPARNSNYQERRTALDMAHKAMDSQNLSYASCGFSQEDAERIEQQFSVATGHERDGSSRTGYKHQWWNPFRGGSTSQQASSQQSSSSRRGEEYTANDDSVNDPSSPNYQYQVNYEVVSDYQGPVPYWDGGS